MQQNRSIKVVAAATIISRFTGFLRDMFVYAVFGTSAINSAFIIAFTLPNLCRRFMGEGALTSAVVPVLADAQAKEGQASAWELLNRILSRSLAVLMVVTAIGIGIFSLIHLFDGLEQRWYLSAQLGVWIFPYLIFVCLSAIVCVALNLQKRFSTAAMAQIWVNLSMVVALAFAVLWISDDEMVRMAWLVGGVLVGGLLQLLLPVHALKREGWPPKLDYRPDGRLRALYKLFGPGLIGATVAQTNAVVSQLFAFGLNAGAVSVLFLANRLMQLPLGVFAIAVTTVTFPIIAAKAAAGDLPGFRAAYDNGSKLIYSLMIPAGVGLAILSIPILEALFQWGAFDASSVAQTAPILAIYALGIPFYASSAFVTRGFHSQKDTITPVRWSVVTFVLNLVLSMWLKEVWGTIGLVCANVFSTVVFALGLRWGFHKAGHQPLRLSRSVTGMLISTAIMAIVVGALVWALPSGRLFAFVKIFAGAGVGVITYAASLRILSPQTFRALKELIIERKS